MAGASVLSGNIGCGQRLVGGFYQRMHVVIMRLSGIIGIIPPLVQRVLRESGTQ